MKTITLRGCDEELARALAEAGEREGKSVNRVILETLRAGLLRQPPRRRRHTDLDQLAGTWTEAERESFDRAISDFELIDPEEWQ